MTIDIKKDLEIIEAATDGPWFSTEDWNGATFVNVDSDAEPTVAETMGGTKGADMDAEYIAHFNPSYVKELVEALKEARDLLNVASCPNNCTDGAYHGSHGEPVQCQFCYERKELLER